MEVRIKPRLCAHVAIMKCLSIAAQVTSLGTHILLSLSHSRAVLTTQHCRGAAGLNLSTKCQQLTWPVPYRHVLQTYQHSWGLETLQYYRHCFRWQTVQAIFKRNNYFKGLYVTEMSRRVRQSASFFFSNITCNFPCQDAFLYSTTTHGFFSFDKKKPKTMIKHD